MRIELTTFRLWDWRAAYCANGATTLSCAARGYLKLSGFRCSLLALPRHLHVRQLSSTSTITVDDIKKPLDLLITSLASLKYKCSNGKCSAIMPLQNLVLHSSQCTGNPLQMPSTPSKIPLRDVLHAPVDKTPSRRAMGHLMKRMMMSSSAYGTNSTITVPTGGQVR